MNINGPFVEKILKLFIREEMKKSHFSRGIIGLSGGLDSSVCTALAAGALGPKNLTALILPYGKVSQKDVEDAELLVRALGIKSKTIDISPMINIYYERYPFKNNVAIGNKMARERMSILYDFSVREQALVLGTSNKSELLIGYGTIHGDMACAINPLGDLYKTQVRMLARHIGIPKQILNKKPSAGLWKGQTDEGEIGLTYKELDEILFLRVDNKKSREEILAKGYSEKSVDHILKLIKKSSFKRNLPPIPKISTRTVGHDFLYPRDWE
ncbi:MAG: NAD+ synthase [Candidatus Aminicenantes bacterium]|nr:NAD+ synthase [Candidatus Aminicenantes bacterium]